MRGTLRERQPSVWELRVHARRGPLTGEYRQVSRVFGGSKRQPERALIGLSSEVIDGRFAGTARTVAVLLEQRIEVKGRPQETIDGYGSLPRSRLGPALGGKELRKLTPADLDALAPRPPRRAARP